MNLIHLLACACSLLAATSASLAQAVEPVEPAHSTLEALATGNRISAGLPEGQALDLRGTWLLGGDDLLRAELLDERKFGSRGGIAGIGFGKGLAAGWFATGNVALGHGGVNWANRRIDGALATKFGAQQAHILQLSGYHASYDEQRRDRGVGLSLVSYALAPLVLQIGATFNTSDPGSVHSTMAFASGTWGREGEQYLSLRLASGSEGYQAIGGDRPQLVGFDSRSVTLNWRRWLGPRWGVIGQIEHYHNPGYERLGLSVGLFTQW